MVVLIFSYNRALQLDATLRSLMFHCEDITETHIKILFKADSNIHRNQYVQIQKEYLKFPEIQFVEETVFRADVISLMVPFDYVLFLVDDNLFVEPFKLKDIVQILELEKESIGFSLRLGKNTNYCYSLNCQQDLPDYNTLNNMFMKFNWTNAKADFGYPLEVSSSVYSVIKLLPLIQKIPFNNPNTFEANLDANKSMFQNDFPFLHSYEKSKTFCAPINKVQTVAKDNRVGNRKEYSANELAKIYNDGKRIDISNYIGFTPNACHQEVKISFIEPIQNKPLVSIIIPCYKQADLLPDSLSSVLNQTYTNWECIVVNDGSPDNTSEIVNDYISKYPEKNIRLLEVQNGGLSSARNRGIKLSTGGFILPLDSDDKLHPEYLERFVNTLLSNPDISFVYCDRQDFGISDDSVQSGEFDFSRLIYANHLNYCSMYHRSVWNDAGGYDENIDSYEDWNFWISAGKKGHNGKRIPELLFYYRVKEESMYADALKRDSLLQAQIVCNHPELYLFEHVEKAKKIYLPEKKYSLVSVIVPTHNRPDLLDRALNSIVNQTYPRIEIIVINDASVDISEVISKYQHRVFSFKYIMNETNKGLAGTRNVGIKNATGKYIAYLDDDDIYYENHISLLVKSLEKNVYSVAYTDALRTVQEKVEGQLVTKQKILDQSTDFNPDLLIIRNITPVLCVMHEKTCVDNIGYFNETFPVHEDWDFLVRLSREYKFIHIPQVTAEFFYRNDQTNMTTTRQEEFDQTCISLYERNQHLLSHNQSYLYVLQNELLRLKKK